MKKIVLFAFALLMSKSALACTDNMGNTLICPGDLVYSGTDYRQGAIVVGVNTFRQSATVKSNYNGALDEVLMQNLDVTSGCLGIICVGDIVYKGQDYRLGAKVEAINAYKNTVTVRSVYNSQLGVENVNSLDSANACAGNFCVGDLIYVGTDFRQGAKIEGISVSGQQLTVRSVYNSQLDQISADSAHITRGCIYGVCVGDIVYKGNDYRNGADVVAINPNNLMVTVRSRYNSSLGLESATALSVTDQALMYDMAARTVIIFLP